MAKGKKSATKKKAETEPSAEEEKPTEEAVEVEAEEIPKKKPAETAAKGKKTVKAEETVKTAEPAKAAAPKKAVKKVKPVEPAPAKPAEAPKPAPAKPAEAPKPAPAKPAEAPKPAPAKPAEAPKPAPAKPAEAPKPAPAKPAEAPKPAPAKPAEAPKPAPVKPAEAPKVAVAEAAEVPKPAPVKPAEVVKKKKEITVSEVAGDEKEKGPPPEIIEFTDKFNKEQAFSHVESLAFPRMVGTEGEKKAADYIKGKFSEMNLNPIEEEFTFTNYATDILIRGLHGLQAGLLIISLILFSVGGIAGQIVAACLSIALIIVTFYISIWARFCYQFQNSKGLLFKTLVKEYKSKNIIAKIDCAGGKEKASGDIVIFSHYDSKGQIFSELWRMVFYYISWILSIVLPILYISLTIIVSSIPSTVIIPYSILLMILTIVALAAFALLEFNLNKNDSPGAINNASGIGVLLELANIHAKDPLENHNLTFVATSAEEMGLFGAISFLKAHEKEFNPVETNFLNIEDVGARGHFNIPGPIGFPPQLPCLEVEQLVKKTLVRRQIPLKEGSENLMKVISPWIFTGSINEDIIPMIRGFNANLVSFGGYSLIPFLIEGTIKSNIINTKKDTKDQVDVAALDIFGKVMAELLKRMDIRGRT